MLTTEMTASMVTIADEAHQRIRKLAILKAELNRKTDTNATEKLKDAFKEQLLFIAAYAATIADEEDSNRLECLNSPTETMENKINSL
jgi:hypothetical protein